MDFMMELPLEIGRPTGADAEGEVEEEGEEYPVEDPFVVRMVEGCAENWTFTDWKKVRGYWVIGLSSSYPRI